MSEHFDGSRGSCTSVAESRVAFAYTTLVLSHHWIVLYLRSKPGPDPVQTPVGSRNTRPRLFARYTRAKDIQFQIWQRRPRPYGTDRSQAKLWSRTPRQTSSPRIPLAVWVRNLSSKPPVRSLYCWTGLYRVFARRRPCGRPSGPCAPEGPAARSKSSACRCTGWPATRSALAVDILAALVLLAFCAEDGAAAWDGRSRAARAARGPQGPWLDQPLAAAGRGCVVAALSSVASRPD